MMMHLYKIKLEDSSKLSEIAKLSREYHFKNKPINRENVWNLIRFLSDFFINHNRNVIDIRNESANAPTYVYKFTYLGDEPDFYSFDQGPQPLQGMTSYFVK